MKISFKLKIRPANIRYIHEEYCVVCGGYIDSENWNQWKRLGELLKLDLISQEDIKTYSKAWISFLCYKHDKLTDEQIIKAIT